MICNHQVLFFKQTLAQRRQISAELSHKLVISDHANRHDHQVVDVLSSHTLHIFLVTSRGLRFAGKQHVFEVVGLRATEQLAKVFLPLLEDQNRNLSDRDEHAVITFDLRTKHVLLIVEEARNNTRGRIGQKPRGHGFVDDDGCSYAKEPTCPIVPRQSQQIPLSRIRQKHN